eukprot:4441591-Amphidinium_carterae.1
MAGQFSDMVKKHDLNDALLHWSRWWVSRLVEACESSGVQVSHAQPAVPLKRNHLSLHRRQLQTAAK